MMFLQRVVLNDCEVITYDAMSYVLHDMVMNVAENIYIKPSNFVIRVSFSG